MSDEKCPECGGELRDEMGQGKTCRDCHYSTTAVAALIRESRESDDEIDPALMGFAKLADRQEGRR
jgi:hypothetical protein